MQRSVITILVVVLAAFVAFSVYRNTTAPTAPAAAPTAAPVSPAGTDNAAAPAAKDAASAASNAATPAGAAAVAGAPEAPAVAPAPLAPIAGLQVIPVTERQPEPVIGSANTEASNPYLIEAQLTPWGGGIVSLKLSRYVAHVGDKTPLVVQQKLILDSITDAAGVTTHSYRYPMAANAVIINDVPLNVAGARWQVTASDADSATFTLLIGDAEKKPVVRLERTWKVNKGRYDVQVSQRIINLTNSPIRAAFSQFGPGDMPVDDAMMDMRHLFTGFNRPRQAGEGKVYYTTETHQVARGDVLSSNGMLLWPLESDDPALDLMWIGATNRYFAAVMHTDATSAGAIPPLERVYTTLRADAWGGSQGRLVTVLSGPAVQLGAAGSPDAAREINVELYAGPRDPDILKTDPVYTRLNLGSLIVYNLGGMCAFCTFDWLAVGLLNFLRGIHYVVRDWGVAIIVLVAIVRLILHPLTKSSQVNMMKMSKQMQAMKPELDKIKAKYPDDQTKQQQEMMRLYKEHGVNPMGMGLGCLPMFLQMPIWIALYAMLYFAIELRHEPAFYGIFQLISGGKWLFLADLSAPDNCIPLPAFMHFTVPLFNQVFTHINVLPILLGFVFFIQQQYMQATSPAMDEQVRQQQAMMKWMVLLFPVMLYWSPSGLTLYIFASTTVGILESKRVRAHLKQLEAEGRLFEKKPGGGGFMERLMKAAEQRMQNAQQQQGGGKGKGPKR